GGRGGARPLPGLPGLARPPGRPTPRRSPPPAPTGLRTASASSIPRRPDSARAPPRLADIQAPVIVGTGHLLRLRGLGVGTTKTSRAPQLPVRPARTGNCIRPLIAMGLAPEFLARWRELVLLPSCRRISWPRHRVATIVCPLHDREPWTWVARPRRSS